MNTTHTATPWRTTTTLLTANILHRLWGADNKCILQMDNFSAGGANQNAEADAQHIIRCVNSHDDLLHHLELLTDVLSAMNECGICQHNGRVKKAKAVIAKAKGEA